MKKSILVLVLSIVCVTVFGQTRTISGTIIDELTGEALIAATVRSATDASIGSLTDIDGSFSLEIDENTTQLIVSYVGYEQQTIDVVAGQSNYSINLASDNSLAEVVVTTYGKDGQTPVPGSLAIIEAERIENVPIASFDQILQGQAPGLTVLSGSGQPGTSSTVRIRGQATISGDTDPLYILDGIQIPADQFATLNPNDFSVAAILKDAAATSQYGSRAANGVIVLKTKEGVQGKTQIRYTTQFGFSEPGRQRFDLMNAAELLAFQEVAQRGAGWFLSPNNPTNQGLSGAQQQANADELARLRANDNDFRDVFFRQGNTESHDLSFSGGDAKTRYYSSFSIFNEDGIQERSDLRRQTARLNLDHNVNDNLRFGIKGFVGNSDRNFIESENGINLANGFAAVYLANPFETVFDENGNILSSQNDPEGINRFAGYTGSNAVARLLQDTNTTNEFSGTGTFDIEYDFFDDMFTVKLLAGIDYSVFDTVRTQDPNGNAGVQQARGNAGFLTQADTQNRTLTLVPTLNFYNEFNDKHIVNFVGGYEYLDERSEFDNFTGFQINDLFPFPPVPNSTQFTDPDSGEPIAIVSGAEARALLAGGFIQGTYTFDDRYEIGGGLRQDASSRFGPSNSEARFWNIGAKWILENEPFLANAENLNLLRLRASAGTTGNQNLPGFNDTQNFQFLPTLGAGNNVTEPFLTINRLSNPDLKWEEKLSYNLGTDFEFFNRVRGSLDVYHETSEDLFIQRAISGTTGQFTIPIFNAGDLRNQGVELELNGEVIKTQNFEWNIGANIAYNDNEITGLGGEDEFPQGTSIIRVGEPLGSHFIEPWAGVDPATGDPLYFTPDGQVTNNFNLVEPDTGAGTFIPPWVGGFDSTLTWKDLSIFTQFNFAADYARFNNQNFFLENPNFAQFNQSRLLNNIWTQPGDITEIQRIGTARQFSTKDIEDSDFLRFRNLRASYNVPSNWVSSTNVLTNANIFLNATNLFTWTNFTGFDPEDSNNIAGFEFPLPRQVTLGVNIGL